MLPVIALLGRPNVGKSTLFNFLTRSRDALVANFPGLTRDRQFGWGKVGPRPYLVVDTGGITDHQEGLDALTARQSLKALEEADRVLFMVDGRGGLTANDLFLLNLIRRSGKPAHLVVNKTEGLLPGMMGSDFYALGLGEPFFISATHGDRISGMMAAVCDLLPPDDEPSGQVASSIHVAIVGRPNVGKSTLVNRILGEERVVVSDQPGTTRDAVSIPFERDGQAYTLIDTAGVRRRARVKETIEKFSVIKTLQAIDAAQVVVILVDAQEGISDQDASIIGTVIEHGRAIVLAINKWDGLDPDQRTRVKDQLEFKLPFLDFARGHFISALHGTGVGDLYASIKTAYASATLQMPTPLLTRLLEQAVAAYPPPLAQGRRIKLRYAHQGGKCPPTVVIHGAQATRLPDAYRRYLTRSFQKALGMEGTPLRLELRSPENPYVTGPTEPRVKVTKSDELGEEAPKVKKAVAKKPADGKPVVKRAASPNTKSTRKATYQPAARRVAKAAAKPVRKATGKPATKRPAKGTTKPVRKTASKPPRNRRS